MKACYKWTYEEELFCCKKYIWFMFKSHPEEEKAEYNLTEYDSYREICKFETIYDLIDEISEQYKHIPIKSIERKFRQIKKASNDDCKKDDFVALAPYGRYSKQLERALGDAFDEVHREVTHEPPPETIEERYARIERDIEKHGTIIVSRDSFDEFSDF